MRVISGIYKGRSLKGHDIVGTRPTMDRVKESVFAIIQGYIKDAVVLDLFAGSGNLGIEALSNGASCCYFNDSNFKCINAISSNIKNIGISKECILLNKDYKDAIEYFKNQKIKFDIIFLDPPYKDNVNNLIVELIVKYNLLNDDGIMVLEMDNDFLLENSTINIIKVKRYGDKVVYILGINS